MPIPAGSLVVQWLRLCVSTAEGECLIPGQRTKVLYASGCGQKKKKKKCKSLIEFVLYLKNCWSFKEYLED